MFAAEVPAGPPRRDRPGILERDLLVLDAVRSRAIPFVDALARRHALRHRAAARFA